MQSNDDFYYVGVAECPESFAERQLQDKKLTRLKRPGDLIWSVLFVLRFLIGELKL